MSQWCEWNNSAHKKRKKINQRHLPKLWIYCRKKLLAILLNWYRWISHTHTYTFYCHLRIWIRSICSHQATFWCSRCGVDTLYMHAQHNIQSNESLSILWLSKYRRRTKQNWHEKCNNNNNNNTNNNYDNGGQQICEFDKNQLYVHLLYDD